ncbi:MAG: tetratricopeptide repeat protein [Candidatus Omnitrophica bacterium]|nr:tetratricopeptide repeat protein [Candidatus Omnitrophota bacterium]
MADAWAARAAWQELSSAPIQRTIALWQRAERSDPWNSRFPLEQGERCLRAAQVPQAAAAYQRVVARSPWLGFAWFRLGQTRSHLGDAAGADEAFRQAKRRDPNLAYALRAAKENP